MSLSYKKLNTVKILDPRTDISEDASFGIRMPASQINYQPFVSTNFSTSIINFSANPPSNSVIMVRKVYADVQLQLDFTGTNGSGGNLLNIGVTDSLRAFPLSNGIMETLSVQINNTTNSLNLRDYMDALMRFQSDHDKKYDLSGTPTYQDNYQDYDEGVGANNNPMGAYADNPYISGRGAFEYDIISNTPTAASVIVRFIEPLFLSPLEWSNENSKGLINVSSFTVKMNLGSLYRCWSHSDIGGSTINSIDVEVGNINPPTLYCSFLTPQMTGSGSHVPKTISYSYYDIDRYITSVGIVNSGASSNFLSSNIQLNSVPGRILVFLKRVDSTFSWDSTDTYARIKQIDITFNNISGILSSATEHDLYQISVKNGLKYSWYEWQRKIGSVLAIDFGEDVSLGNPDLASGVLGQFQLMVKGTMENIHPSENISYNVYVVAINEGLMQISKEQSIPQTGVLSRRDVLDTYEKPNVNLLDISDPYGGSFRGKVRSLENFLKSDTAKNIGRTALKAAKTITPLLGSLMAMGYSIDESNEMISTHASGVLGGREISNNRRAKNMAQRRMRERL